MSKCLHDCFSDEMSGDEMDDAVGMFQVAHVLLLYVPPILIFPGLVGNILCAVILQVLLNPLRKTIHSENQIIMHSTVLCGYK